MTDRKTLERRLEALASVGVSTASGRMARSLGPDSLLRRLLIEFDATIMPRRMTVETDTGRAASFLVANSRLIRIESMVGEASDVGVALKANDEELNSRLEDQFRALLAGAKEMTTLTDQVDEGVDPQAAGPSARALAQTWGIALETSDRASSECIGAFLAEVKETVVAWLTPGEGSGGEADKIDKLTAFAEAYDVGSETAPDGARWSFLSLRRAPADGEIAVRARHGETIVYVLVPRERLTAIADAWRTVVLG